MDKLIFHVARPTRPAAETARPVIRITPEAYNLVEEISAKSGFSNAFIASELIKFAAERAEIKQGGVEFDDG